MRFAQAHAQRGAAVVMALFVVVLCTLSVAPLIWIVFASAKTISVAASRDQAELVARSGIDWARIILREDGRVSATDTLTEPWAVPLAESRVNQSLMRQGERVEDREVVMTGQIEDAQGRFNLRNLGLDNASRAVWTTHWVKLATLLGIAPEQYERVEQTLARMFPGAPANNNDPEEASAQRTALTPANSWDEFRNRYDITEDTWQQLRPYVVLLPRTSPVNANTASAEVLYAAIEELSFSQAQGVIAQRERTSFNQLADVQQAVGAGIAVNNALISVGSQFFLVEGSAQVDAAVIRTRALLERRDQRVYVIWRQ